MTTHALITGASRGVGAATARAFHRAGFQVTVVARPSPELDQLAAELGALALPADLADAAQVSGLIARAAEARGLVDVLVNNAAVAHLGPVAGMTPDQVARTVAVNLTAPVELSRQALPGMLARHSGVLLNVCSIGGIAAFPTLTLYGATKSGLSMFVTGLQRELLGTGVTASIALLGEVLDTGMNDLAHASPAVSAVSARLARVRAMPTITPDDVGARLVRAAARRQRFVAIPRRMAPLEALRVIPTLLTDALFTGIERSPREAP
jgi:short-subunit dehydrogenase